MNKFKPVSSQVDFPALERELLNYWYKEGIVEKYLNKNKLSDKKFSFLDGPITANNPMGVHHAWGRTYKDLWQRFFNMKGYSERFQNGFDEQGLWVEVEVEKELGLHSKKDIENLIAGDKFKSLEKFINLCKERVKKYSDIQTEQSKRLGYFMNWDNSYHTSSDENNYAIWNFIKVVNDKGWLYKGHDSVPWCPRCGTSISQHEILTEDYKEIVHESIYFKLPIKNKENEYLLVWTTTPWTIPANVAVAVDPDLDYVEVEMDGENYIVAKDAAQRIFGDIEEIRVVKEYKGKDLVGWEYLGLFDDLLAVKQALANYVHRVIATDTLILPISAGEGTGLVHIATGAGAEDFALGKKENLPVIAPIDETAIFVGGFGELGGLGVKEAIKPIISYLKGKGYLYKTQEYAHRYPMCWRCKTELVWRVVDEWYIAMDRADDFKKTYREQMIEVTKKINWIPKWGLDRELDWLKNMHDWLISKKRYWGLALPIWECDSCDSFEVLGGKEELEEKAVGGWKEFTGNSPHRPWVDQVKIKCSKCGAVIFRIPDVGNPWLDAGIVPFSTMPNSWFPADFVTESFPGQFKNWFYSLIAMSTVLIGEAPFKNILGFASLLDEKGEAMHKSKGNAIEFNEAADKIGADIMRWLFVLQNPENNLNFGYTPAQEVKRRFYLIFWNSYKFFVDYAISTNWDCKQSKNTAENLTVLDRWILARLTELVLNVNKSLEKFDASSVSRMIEEFVVLDFSTWYIRRSRDRVGPDADILDNNTALSVMHGSLVVLTKIAAPFIPFITEEMFKNLTGEESVHLQNFPEGDKSLLDNRLIGEMRVVREIGEKTHALRKQASIKLRQPLALLTYSLDHQLDKDLEQILAEEVNVKIVKFNKSASSGPQVDLDTKISAELAKEGEARELIRQVQKLRKEQNLILTDKTKIIVPSWPADFESQILQNTASVSISKGGELKVVKVE